MNAGPCDSEVVPNIVNRLLGLSPNPLRLGAHKNRGKFGYELSATGKWPHEGTLKGHSGNHESEQRIAQSECAAQGGC